MMEEEEVGGRRRREEEENRDNIMHKNRMEKDKEMTVISHMHVGHMITDKHNSIKHPVYSTQGIFSKHFILMLVVI